MFSPLAGKLILDPALDRAEKYLMQQKQKQHRAKQNKHDVRNGHTSTGLAMNNSKEKKKHENVLLKHKKANVNQASRPS